MFARLFAPTLEVQAHCDLPCGVYDPAQARIEAESIKAIIAKVADNDDPDFRTRALIIKEQRAELVKHHLWVLWTDYFKPPHFEKFPQLHQLVNEATKLAGAADLFDAGRHVEPRGGRVAHAPGPLHTWADRPGGAAGGERRAADRA
jgi:nickel superoxide dismutase